MVVLKAQRAGFDDPDDPNRGASRVLTPHQEASLQSIPFALAAALIIGFLAGFAAGGAWGASTCDDDKSVCWAPMEPINPGMTPGTEKPRIILGIDVDYPPYGTLAYPPDEPDVVVAGFGPDIAKALEDVCDIDVTVIQAWWNDCWDYDGLIGDSLKTGDYHGCMTYTHTVGVRNRYMDFSTPILDQNKYAGFLTRLDASGNPLVSPVSDLSDVTIVDISGWAPTADTTTVLVNDCDNSNYFSIDSSATGNVIGTTDVVDCTGDYCTNANDIGLWMLFNGQADVVYLYSDQAYLYKEACAADATTAGVNCDLWNQLGLASGYAYIHTGMDEFAYGGTTLSISKKGSGLPEILDPCIDKLLLTEKYYTICDKWGLADSCFQNSYFPAPSRRLAETESEGVAGENSPPGRRLAGDYDIPTNEQAAGCSNGYCSCADLPSR